MTASQYIRDLHWAIHSPALLSAAPDVPTLDPEKIDPQHLAAFIEAAPGHRVGRYFERLILYWLQHVRRVEIVAQSLQLHEGKRTIGEIDLLFRDEQNKLTHWEIAVKFYLHFADDAEIGSHFIGPNAADTFERKMERLFEHQLPRSVDRFPDIDVRQAFVKGMIFYHPNQPRPQTLPHRMSQQHQRGVWIRQSELNWLTEQPGFVYRVLEKPFWLTNDTDGLIPAEAMAKQLTNKFSTRDQPILIGGFRANDHEENEVSRIFVVADRWPQIV